MAIIEVKVPQLSESVAEATLLDWHKKEGEPVQRDENLIDIETDKVVLELPAPADGVLVKIIKNAKDAVGSGEVIAQIDPEQVFYLRSRGIEEKEARKLVVRGFFDDLIRKVTIPELAAKLSGQVEEELQRHVLAELA